jgi:hypothetical protein
MNEELLIIFQNESQMIDFCLWFKEQGFSAFVASKYNGQNSEEISCLKADEFPQHADENFFEGKSYFELS